MVFSLVSSVCYWLLRHIPLRALLLASSLSDLSPKSPDRLCLVVDGDSVSSTEWLFPYGLCPVRYFVLCR